jgi:formylglycine-generating enzyme required for sulfatase activity
MFARLVASPCPLLLGAAPLFLACSAAPSPAAPAPLVVVVPRNEAPAPVVPVVAQRPLSCPTGMALLAGGAIELGGVARSLGDFCMDVTEVTAGAYARCVQSGACDDRDLKCDDAWTYDRPAMQDHPINCVSWEQADRYCRADGKRLPTLEEWEWAAEARTEKRRFSWGDSEPAPDQMCWSRGGSRATTCPVGGFPASRTPQGIDDLFGNVWEWLSPADRAGVPNVARGGSWLNDSLDMLEGENAGGFVPGFVRNDVVGFRCVMDAVAVPESPRTADKERPAPAKGTTP